MDIFADYKEYDKQKCQSGNHPMVNLPFHDQKHCMACRMSESEIKFYNVVVAADKLLKLYYENAPCEHIDFEEAMWNLRFAMSKAK